MGSIPRLLSAAVHFRGLPFDTSHTISSTERPASVRCTEKPEHGPCWTDAHVRARARTHNSGRAEFHSDDISRSWLSPAIRMNGMWIHRTNNWILVKAMQALLAKGAISHNTQLVGISYDARTGRHALINTRKRRYYASERSGEARTGGALVLPAWGAIASRLGSRNS